MSGFENVIGSPFADVIIGSSGDNRIDGGGGADAILGQGGNDTLYGGAEGDYLQGGGGTDTAYGQAGTNECAADVEARDHCSGTAEAVHQRDRSKISVGFMVAGLPSNLHWTELYMVGSNGVDNVTDSCSWDSGIDTVNGCP